MFICLYHEIVSAFIHSIKTSRWPCCWIIELLMDSVLWCFLQDREGTLEVFSNACSLMLSRDLIIVCYCLLLVRYPLIIVILLNPSFFSFFLETSLLKIFSCYSSHEAAYMLKSSPFRLIERFLSSICYNGAFRYPFIMQSHLFRNCAYTMWVDFLAIIFMVSFSWTFRMCECLWTLIYHEVSGFAAR